MSYVLKSAAQDFLVVPADRSHRAAINVLANDVCGIEATSKPTLHDSVVYGLLLEPEHGEHRHDFKEGDIDLLLLNDLEDLVGVLHHLALGNALLVDLDALAERLDVRRGEEAGAEAAVLQRCGSLERDRAFAIGASYVNSSEAILRLSELLSQLRH